MPSSEYSEFMFQAHDENEDSFHNVFHKQFADQIHHELRSFNFIWHEELVSQSEPTKLCIQGSAKISIDLLQSQYINLNSI
jgi:hypothetical protein